MKIPIKTTEEIAIMRAGGKILAAILNELKNMAKIGMETKILDNRAKELMEKFQVQSSFKNYHGYPAYICTSINEEVVHTIPSAKKLQEGDIISIDCGIIHKGLHVDATVLTWIEPLKPELKNFVETASAALSIGIDAAIPGNHVGDISAAIEKFLRRRGFNPVKELTGHGIGRMLHEPPQIPNIGEAGHGPLLEAGMTLAIEPIFNFGKAEIRTLGDGWTIVTQDGLPSAQIEHTVVISENGPKILTTIN